MRLDETLGLPVSSGDRDVYVAAPQADGRRFGLVVDRVLNTEEESVSLLLDRIGEVVELDTRLMLALDTTRAVQTSTNPSIHD